MKLPFVTNDEVPEEPGVLHSPTAAGNRLLANPVPQKIWAVSLAPTSARKPGLLPPMPTLVIVAINS